MSVVVIDVEAAVRTLLVDDAEVSALISGTVDGRTVTRIYPDRVPQDAALPVLVYQEISERRDESHDGPGLRHARIQVDAYAATRAAALELAEAVFSVLCPQGPPAGTYRRTVTVDGVNVEIQKATPGVRGSSYEPDTKLYRRRRDYLVAASAA